MYYCGAKFSHCLEWQHNLLMLIQYIKIHGNVQVQEGQFSRNLGRWARQQRYAFHSGLMLDGYLNILCDVGFNLYTLEWNDMYMELLLCKHQFKNCLAPTPHSPSLIRKYNAQSENELEQKYWQHKYYYMGLWAFR